MEKDNPIKTKSFAFAVRIVNLYKYLIENKKEFVLSKQLLRSSTSIGANVEEGIVQDKVKKILSQNYQFHLKRLKKLITGLDYWLNVNILNKKCLSLCLLFVMK